MRPETAAALYDMSLAAGRIAEATHEKRLADFADDRAFQSAIERQFGILGEALVRIRTLEPPIFECFPDAAKIVGLRNVIVHGYDAVDAKVIWSIIEERLSALRKLVETLLEEAQKQGL